MPDWPIRLTAREEVANRTMAFHFERPREFEFIAGQFVELTVMSPCEVDFRGPSRTLTIASAPFESELMFAMRMRDTAFKRTLQALPVGGKVIIDDPVGSFVLHKDSSRPAVFLAGGIGITPFLSIVRQVTYEVRSHQLFLFYVNRQPEEAAFLHELHNLESKNPHFRLVPTMTQMWRSKEKWEGETGYIGAEMIARYTGSLVGPIYYLAGPPGMIEGTRQKLLDHGVKREDINADPFDGY